jgi:hypothetical protein
VTDRPRRGPSPEGPWSSGESDPPAAVEGLQPEPPTGPGAALRPEDFWEGAAVQEVIAAVDPVPGRSGIASRARLPRRATRTLIAARQLPAPRLVVAVICAIAGICIVVLGASPGTHSAPRRSAATHHAATRSLEAALLPLSIPRKSRPARPHRRLHSTGTSKPAQPANHGARTPAVAADYTPVSAKPMLRSSPTSGSTTVADRPSPPAASTSDYKSQTPAQQTPVQRNTSSRTSSNADSDSLSAPAQTSSAPSQPVRAFGQNGVLGAGSSPNG